jgi:L-ascorbate oxidase
MRSDTELTDPTVFSGTYDPIANEEKLKGYNPVLRDTTNLYRYETIKTPGVDAGWRGWRLRVIQPGVWMIHCHILQHMIMGMQSVWVFGDADQIMRVPYPAAEGYLQYGGSVFGNETFTPSYIHQLGP